jgi:proteasome lid subunit RPN8/RPN11
MSISTILNTLFRKRPTPRLTCRKKLWRKIQSELRARGNGKIESGAFLLGRNLGGTREILDFIAYDDIDPNCLQGDIQFDGSNMDMVWARCRAQAMDVVADIHTHPGGYGQSSIDRANPMMPQKGHLALIMPNFADRLYLPGQIGIYEFLGPGRWVSHSALGSAFFTIRGLF